MRGCLKAQLLLAPVLAAALPARYEVNTPHALINLDVNTTSDEVALQGTTLRLDVLESTSPCGYGNVTLNDQKLAQDENGVGSGLITTEDGNIIVANWGFTCIHLEDEFQGQLMTFEVVSVDNKEVQDAGFVVQFQQMAPASISFLNGTGSIIEPPIPVEDTNGKSKEETSSTLDDELAELKSMMRQLAALEYAISSKVHRISGMGYDFKPPHESHSFAECDSLKCIMKTMYSRAKHVAGKLYGHRPGYGGPFGSRPGRHHWPGKHGSPHHQFPPHHHEGDHGNHTFPRPPHHPPHPPPFCHCAPPPPPHGPHDPDGYPPPPPHEFYDECPPHGHPPPSHEVLGDQVPQGKPRPNAAFAHDMEPNVEFDDRPELPLHPPKDEAAFPLPPELVNHDRPPHPGHIPFGSRPPHPHPPPFHPPGLLHAISAIHIGAIIVLLGLLFSAIHTRCFTTSREDRRRTRETGCQRHEGRTTKRVTIYNRYGKIIRWLKESVRRQEVEDEEKDAMMRRLHGCESEEEDNLSTTMEQEIAQFRAVASVVGDLVEAEEGRSRGHTREIQQHNTSAPPAPPSPTSAFLDYASVDEELPAYDEGMNDSRFVADGFRYTPGSSCYISTEPSTESSLDENLGRKD